MLQILGKIGFDWQVALANLINFLIVFWILKKYFFKGIKKAITDRQAKIKKGLDDAKRAEADLVMANAKYEEIVAEAKTESKNILSEAGVKKEEIMASAKSEAVAEADKLKEKARAEIAKMEADDEEKLRLKAVDVVVSSVENILKERVDRSSAEKIVEAVVR